jgi:predicted membrane protein
MEQIVEILTHIDKLITITFWFFAICIIACFGFQIIKYTVALIYDFHQTRKMKRKERKENERTKSST